MLKFHFEFETIVSVFYIFIISHSSCNCSDNLKRPILILVNPTYTSIHQTSCRSRRLYKFPSITISETLREIYRSRAKREIEGLKTTLATAEEDLALLSPQNNFKERLAKADKEIANLKKSVYSCKSSQILFVALANQTIKR